MRMSKIVSLVLAIVMMLSCLVGCGGTNTPDPTPDSGDQGNTVTNPLAGTYEIEIWVSEKKNIEGTQSVVSLTESQIEKFMAKNPGIIIKATVSGLSEANAGSLVVGDVSTAPDIYCFAQDQLARLVQANALAAPGGDVAKLISELNDAESVAAATVGSTLYAYPMTSDNGYYLYYDTSIVSDPTSLEAIIADCEEAYANNEEHKYFRYALENGWYTASFFFGAGCTSVWTMSDDGIFTAVNDTFNSDKGLIAMKGMEKIAKSKCCIADGKAADDIAGAAAIVTGIWNHDVAVDHFGENLGVAPLPSFEVDGKSYHLGSFNGFKLMGVSPQADPKKGAVLQLLAQYLTSEECQLERYDVFNWGPSNINAQNTDKVKNDPALKALNTQKAYAVPQGQVHGSWWDAAATLGKQAKAARTEDDMLGALQVYENKINGFVGTAGGED